MRCSLILRRRRSSNIGRTSLVSGKRNAPRWNECISALRHLDIDVMRGRFGGDSKEIAKFIPVTAMNYNVFDQTFFGDEVKKERALRFEVLTKFGRG